MAIHWQVNFVSLRQNRTYTVNIYDNNFSGTPVQLTGAAQPFSTQEDDNEDWFTPVRRQSGYLRILDTGKDNNGNAFDWKELIPSSAYSRKVTLTHIEGNTTVIDWQGYLQPQTFSGQMYEEVQEREYPLACAISVLDSEDINTNDLGMNNMAALLHYCIEKTGYEWGAVNFSGDDAVLNWLHKRIYWNNFVEIDEDNNRKAKYTYLELLEEVCKFWGWTCRTFGNEIYFLSPDDELYPDFSSISTYMLSVIANEDYEHTEYTTFDWENTNTDRDIYASDNNKVEYLRGIRKAEVTADYGPIEKVYDVPFDAVKEDLNKPPYPNYTSQGDHYQWIKQAVPNQKIMQKVSVDYDEQDTWQPLPFNLLQIYEGNLNYFHRFNWSCYMVLLNGQSETNPPDMTVRIKSSIYYTFTDGMFYVKGTAKANAGGILMCKLNIGDKWWNGSEWTDTQSDFNIMFGNEQDMSQSGDSLPIRTNRSYNDPKPDYEGWGIQIPDGLSLCGKLTFYAALIYMYDGTEPGGGIQAWFNSFEIGFLRNLDSAPNADKNKNIYTGTTNKPFTEDVSVSTIFAADNGNNFGTGLLVNPNNSFCDGVPYSYDGGGGLEMPEQHLLDRIIAHGSNVKKKETVELRSNMIQDLSPTMWLNTVNLSGYPISISREWRDDVTKVVIIEP